MKPMEASDDGHHAKLCTGEFSCTCGSLLAVMAVVFWTTGRIGHVEEELERERAMYDGGPVVRATFRDPLMEGLVSFRASESEPGAPVKVIVGLSFQPAAPRGEYAWAVAEGCEGPVAEELTAAHGALWNREGEGGLALLVAYDESLSLDTILGQSLVISQEGGPSFCSMIDRRSASGATTGDGRPISELAGGTRGAACAGENGAVASTNYLATRAGLRVLAAGGNAADAAVAVQLMLGVSQPESNGIGGGCFIMIYNATTREVVSIDGREEAPAAYHPNIFCGDAECANDPECPACETGPMNFRDKYTGGLPVGVPGTLAAAVRLLKEHGSLPLSELAQPAIATARNGITMTNHLYNAIRGSRSRLQLWPASASLYLTPDESRPVAEVGEKWYNPDLAATYEHIVENGVEEFYQGDLAREIVDAVHEAVNPNSERGGLMEFSDISGYRAVKRAPTHVSFAGPNQEDYELFGMGMPSSGGATMAMIFNLLEAAGLAGDYQPMGFDPHRTTTAANAGAAGGGGAQEEEDEAVAAATNAYDSSTGNAIDSGWAVGADYTGQDLKALADAQNIAFADRNKYMGDADFVDLPMPPGCGRAGCGADAGGLFSKEYARQRWQNFSNATQRPVPWGVPPDWDGSLGAGMLEDDHGTTHFVVVDKDKNVISWTTTIEANMGSSVVVPGRGFPLNNELTDFDSTAVDSEGNPNANAPAGGKRPRRTALHPEERELLGGKRPRSSMSPTIVLKDGEPFMAIGCPGGSSIIGAVSNALLGRLVHEMPLQAAVDLPRMISKNTGSNSAEEALCYQWPEACAEMRAAGYRVDERRPGTLVEAAEILPDGSLLSAADTKRIDSGACGAI